MSQQIAAPRRVIGPIPPRDKTGRLLLKPVWGERVKANVLGEPIRDKDGQPIVEKCDLRDAREYAAWEQGQQPAPDALKGLHLYQIDIPGEPLVQVYGTSRDNAVEIYKKEMGVIRFGEHEPKASEVS